MLSILIVAHAYFGFARAAFPTGVLRMDDYHNYFDNQEIIRAVNMSKPPWFYGHNFYEYEVNSGGDNPLFKVPKPCTYFKKDNVSFTHANFTEYEENPEGNKMPNKPDVQKEKKEGSEAPGVNKFRTSRHLYGEFFTTPGIGKNDGPTNRTTANGILVSTLPGGPPVSAYKLVFSDYRDCAILRPFSKEKLQGNRVLLALPGVRVEELPGLSYPDTREVCVVLLSDDAARRGGLPKPCNRTFWNICGKDRQLTVVFKDSCPRIPNALGC